MPQPWRKPPPRPAWRHWRVSRGQRAIAWSTAPRFASGIGRASFWDLCAKPLGAADFLAIAAALRVLILEDIPQLSASNYNEAKRFVILIDALYEGKVRLIASAADVPERLYIEGEGSFEFERTASRLREMQAVDWGQPLDTDQG